MDNETINNNEFVWIKDPLQEMLNDISEPSGSCGYRCFFYCSWLGGCYNVCESHVD
ncbi:MAG: hypothetical protein MUF15_11820 [Acidobacteria bacterium]|nr:hypothetical protein [Acidobacteriota bacterium]